MSTFAYLMWFFVLFYVLAVFYAVFFSPSNFPLLLLVAYHLGTRLAATESRGGRPWRYFRQLPFWKHFREYFPIEVRLKNPNTKFPKDRKYLFGYHPHGVASMGAMGAFGPLHEEVGNLLDGLEISGCTLESNFRIPGVREFLLAMGGISVSEQSIKFALSDAGRAVLVVLGGANEALHAKPLKHDVVIKRRFGFFRIAISTGSAVVPVYSFGENDIYDQIEHNFARRINEFLVKYLGFFIPIYFGTGLPCIGGTQTIFHPVPKRRAIITVIGDPIHVERKSQVTSEDIEKLKQQYIAGLEDIFDKFADLYSPKRINNLTVVG